VKWIFSTWGKDPRILAWDMWNEPDNMNEGSYGRQEPPEKQKVIEDLLVRVWVWAREKRPVQPLTSGVWKGDWSSNEKLSTMERVQLDHSDIISFHNYGPPAEFEQRIEWLKRYNRPIFCTEYMARGAGSTFDTILPIAAKYRVAAINWGFVQGKSQTWLPWDSWTRPYVLEQPAVWHHDIFYPDGKPYRQREIDIIRALTTAANGPAKAAPSSQ
jgi:hypothetical protein